MLGVLDEMDPLTQVEDRCGVCDTPHDDLEVGHSCFKCLAWMHVYLQRLEGSANA